ncbi:MAG: MATE family efflux transporter [Lachnospiraceae bacterium]|nr:MATE family efflux transporter [Lachnospiraceae bacterium]
MALPTIFSQIIVLIYNMADTFYLGRTNNPYMVAGASLILPVFNICLSLAGLTGVGGGALISRLLGEGKENEAKKVSAFSFYLSIAITAIFSLVMFAFMKPILELLGASENTFHYARQYAFCVIVLGGIPTVLSNVMSNLIRSVGMSKEAGLGITMGGIINIALDPLFMFVLLPKGSEVLGVGIATLISNCIACSYFLCVIFRIKKQAAISLNITQGLPDRRSIGSIFNVGIPSAITTLLFDIDYVIIDKLMTLYGDIQLAAIGIVLKAERLPLNVGIGICQGMMPLVAYNYSAKNHGRMYDIIRFSMKMGLIVSVISIALYEVFAGGIMRIFIPDAQTILLGTGFLRIRCLATPLMFMSFFTVYVFQGFGKGNKSLFLGVMRWAVFNIPMLFLLNRIIGMYGIVWSQVCADILTVLLSFYVYSRYVNTVLNQEQDINKYKLEEKEYE